MELPSNPLAETYEQVMFFDTDAGGVVHNIAYLRFVETARCHLAELLGFPLNKMTETGLFPVIVRTEIDYIRPGLLGDKLTVTCELESISRVRFWCKSEIIRPSDGQTLIRCRQALAAVQLPGGRPTKVPAAWVETYPQLVEKKKTAE